jgi:hypothetical protein
VVGPLAAPSDSGLVFTTVASDSRLEVFFRSPSVAPSDAPRESALLRVTLRNRGIGAP